MAHGEVYAQEFGWDTDFEALVCRIVADYATAPASRSPRQAAWIAQDGEGRRVGCVFCVADDDDPCAAKLRILLVHPDGRGRGLGGRLVDTCLAFARSAGYDRVRLWTNHPLTAARAIYLSRGFALVAEEPHRSFGADLIGQTYELDLSSESTVTASRPSTTRSASASEAVRPGDSMPYRFTSPGTPCCRGPWITKSLFGLPAGPSFGRMPV